MRGASKHNRVSRRSFLQQLAVASAAAGASPSILAQSPAVLTASVIGHTGQGNYGHDLDMVFNGRANVRLAAVADPDPDGRAKAVQRTGAARGYADYREMLAKEKPQLVSVAPRWTDRHHEMARAALLSGAHVISEKPFTRTLAEADDLVALASSAGLKIAVAHQMRLAPNILFLKKELDRGLVGKLLEMRAHGKQDSRAGGEDLLVLGIHLFHLMRFFAGDPLWCTSRVLQQGREISAADAHPATEGIGHIVGDEIFAQFGFAEGVNATFTSRAANRDIAGPWGIELVGSKGVIRMLADICPRVYTRGASNWTGQGKSEQWLPVPGDPMLQASDAEKTVARANARVVDDWLEAIRTNQDPACSGYSAMKALEMVMGVFAAGLSRTRIEFPLKDRRHPLSP